MKKKIIIVSVIISLFLSSCGQNHYLKSGKNSSDPFIITGGCFDVTAVDIPFVTDSYICSDATFDSGSFSYLLKSDTICDIKLITFDSKGSGYNDYSFELPIALNDQKLSSDRHDLIEVFNECESPNLYYFEPFFNDDGLVECYCELNGVKYSDTAPTQYLLYDYKIIWNTDGSVNSIERVDLDDDIRGDLIMHDYHAHDNSGNEFTVTDSGIVRYSDGKYLDTFFDYINSSYKGTIGKVVYANEDLFSAVTYLDSDYISFSVFNRAGTYGKMITPISLYCSSLSDDLKKQIMAFNENSGKYRIGVKNFSDIYRDYNEEFFDDSVLNNVALSGLEESVLSGDIPDMIFEFDGCDKVFVDRLSDKNIILDLKNGFLKDDLISENNYLSNLINISDDKPVYCIIPSFNYDTYVAASSNKAASSDFKLSDYVDYKSQNASRSVLMNSYSCDDFLLKALGFNGYEWINIDSGIVLLGEDYISYLELASELPGSKDEFFELSTTGQLPVDVQFFYTSSSSLPGYYVNSWINLCDEPENIGFPTRSGPEKLIHPSGNLMICSGRKAANGCWEFARTFLLPDYQDAIVSGIPVLQSSFDIWRTNLCYYEFFPDQLVVNNNGTQVSIPQLDQEKADEISDAILSCKNMYFTDPGIEEIILKNAHEFFDGKLSADETVDNTKAEIEQYLKSV